MAKQTLYVNILPIYMKAIEQKMSSEKVTKTQIVEEALDKYLGISQTKTPLETIEKHIDIISNNQIMFYENMEENNKKIDDCFKMVEALYKGIIQKRTQQNN